MAMTREQLTDGAVGLALMAVFGERPQQAIERLMLMRDELASRPATDPPRRWRRTRRLLRRLRTGLRLARVAGGAR